MINIERLKENSYDVVGALLTVKSELGPGLNEKIYQEGLALELAEQGIEFEREKIIHPTYRGKTMESTFYLDFYCKKSIIVELKSVNQLTKEHRAQLFNYMRIVEPTVGILVNFAPSFSEIERYYFDQNTLEIINSDGNSINERHLNRH